MIPHSWVSDADLRAAFDGATFMGMVVGVFYILWHLTGRNQARYIDLIVVLMVLGFAVLMTFLAGFAICDWLGLIHP